MKEGVIIKGVGGLYTVMTGDAIPYSCRARGIFRKDSITPLIGDRVIISDINEEKKEGIIDKINERKNSLIRPSVANIDQILIVISPRAPRPDLLLVDRILVTAYYKGIEPVLVINKVDKDEKESLRLYDEYSLALENILFACAIGKEVDLKLGNLAKKLEGKISVMSGQSGVGKSTLINQIFGYDVMDTGDVSRKTSRGKHTTRHSQMFYIRSHDAYIIDSPGFSLYDIEELEAKSLQKYYPELVDKEACRFQDCSHLGEAGCIVPNMIEKGLFNKNRYERYEYLYEELKEKEADKYK